jgi:hypothetical protein
VVEKSSQGGLSSVNWLTDAFSSSARPLTELDHETRVRIREDVEKSISRLIGFAEHLKCSPDNEAVRWGELVEKACYVPDEKHIISDGNRFVFAGWGFELAGAVGTGVFSTDFDRRLEHKLQFESRDEKLHVPEEDKTGDAISSITEDYSASFDNTTEFQDEDQSGSLPYDNYSPYDYIPESEPVEPQPTTDGGGRQNDHKISPPWWKRWSFWLLLLLLLFLMMFLWKKCNSGSDGSIVFPENPGWIVPIDSTTIISDPDSVRTIVSNRLNIAVASGNMVAFADALREAYPEKSFKIIY